MHYSNNGHFLTIFRRSGLRYNLRQSVFPAPSYDTTGVGILRRYRSPNLPPLPVLDVRTLVAYSLAEWWLPPKESLPSNGCEIVYEMMSTVLSWWEARAELEWTCPGYSRETKGKERKNKA